MVALGRLTLRTSGGRKSDGRILSPAARSYIFTARLWSTRFVPGSWVRNKIMPSENHKSTHRLPREKIVLPLSAIPFEARAHVHASTDNGNGVLQPLGDHRVVHLALGYRSFALLFALLHQLDKNRINAK